MSNFLSEFDAEDFDPITYINNHFPDEGSLNGLDGYIKNLQTELSTVNTEIMSSIQEHALLEVDIQNQVGQSKKHIQNLLQDVGSIKEKAQSSEALVTEMCKDIKSLDIAKKNLTFSITALKKYVMMTTAIDKLREACEARQYKEVANLIDAIEDFFVYFKKYENVAQIQALIKDKDAIISELKGQIIEDFTAWGRGSNSFNKETMKEACVLIETLGIQFRNEIVQLICDIVLRPYNEEFNKSDNATIEVIERRYPWIQRRLKEIEGIYEGIFPEYWGIRCFVLHEFCGMTRLHITEVLDQSSVDDVDVFLKAFDRTIQFEEEVIRDLKKRYGKYFQNQPQKNDGHGKHEDDDEDGRGHEYHNELPTDVPKSSKEFVLTNLPKFKGSISDSFEHYMKPFVDREEVKIREKISEAFAEENYEDTDVLKSSIVMLRSFRSAITKTSQYSRGQTMFDVWRAFQRSMRYYVGEVIDRLGKEERNRGRDEAAFETYACMVVNTGDYCKENVGDLVESVKKALDWPFKEKVNVDEEEELFTNMLNKGIDSLLSHIGAKSEGAFANFTRKEWGKMVEVGDTSDYVKELAVGLNEHVKVVKKTMSETYFTYYLNKLVDLIQKKFLESLYKTRKLTDVATQRLQLDAFEIKTVLGNLIKVDVEARRNSNAQSQVTYINSVNKKMAKVENILKLLAMNNDQFMNNISNFFEDPNAPEVEKLMVIKGLKKSDYTNLFKNILNLADR